MSWLHWLVWPFLIWLAISAVRFGWKRHNLVRKVLNEAGRPPHGDRHIRPITEREARAVLNARKPRQRGRQRVIDPETLSKQDLDGLEDMFSK